MKLKHTPLTPRATVRRAPAGYWVATIPGEWFTDDDEAFLDAHWWGESMDSWDNPEPKGLTYERIFASRAAALFALGEVRFYYKVCAASAARAGLPNSPEMEALIEQRVEVLRARRSN